MPNRLVAVDDNFNLPPEVQAQLTGNFESEFQTLHDEAVSAAASAETNAQAASDSAISADESAVIAAQAAADATAPTDVAVDEGIDRAISDGKISKPRLYLEQIPVQIVGHSYTIVPYPYTSPDGEQVKRVARRIGAATAKSWGRSGSFAIDTLSRLLSPAYLDTTQWITNQSGIILVQNTINELGNASAGNAAYRSTWEMGLRGIIDLVRSRSYLDYDASNNVYSGAWSNLIATNESAERSLNGKLKYVAAASAGAATVNMSTSTDEISVCVCISAASYDLATWELVYGGTVIHEFSGKGLLPESYQGAGDSTVRPYIPVLVRVKGLNAATGTTGNKVLTLRRKAGETGALFHGGFIVPRTPTAAVFVAKEPPRAGSGAATYAANIDWYNAKTDEIVAEYDGINVWSKDLAPGWDSETMISKTDVALFHPNDVGMGFLADKWVEAIDEHITDWHEGVVVF